MHTHVILAIITNTHRDQFIIHAEGAWEYGVKGQLIEQFTKIPKKHNYYMYLHYSLPHTYGHLHILPNLHPSPPPPPPPILCNVTPSLVQSDAMAWAQDYIIPLNPTYLCIIHAYIII